jgi:hypothetical protein
MVERRKTQRRHLLYYGRIYDEDLHKQIGYLVDITEQGFMLLSEERFPVGVTRKLKLEITSDVDERPYLMFAAKSIWCEPDISPERYTTGFEILELKPSDAQIIHNLVQTYGFRDNKNRAE